MTESSINFLLDNIIETAKNFRVKKPYTIPDGEAGIAPIIMLFGPNEQPCILPKQFSIWKDEREKYAIMRAVSATAKASLAQAVSLVSDMRWTNSDKFCEHFGIAKPDSHDRANLARFQDQYRRIVSDQYGGELKNLPRQVWSDGLVAVMKGPIIGTHSRTVFYEQGPEDTVKFTGKIEAKTGDQFNLIPDWWD